MNDRTQSASSSVASPTQMLSRDPVSSHDLPPIPSITDADILAYLRRSAKIADIAARAEQEALILAMSQQLGIQVSEEELQAAGDAFRLEHRLFGSTETFAWLGQQRIEIEDWSEGIRVALLTKKLKEHLFGKTVDSSYVNKRDSYRQIALSQILVLDLPTALSIIQTLRQDKASFCALALEHSKGKQSQQNGGFVGIRFLVELLPEIAQALTTANEGDIVGPVQTRLGYHVLKVEKWLPTQLSESVRTQIIDSLFELWVQQLDQAQEKP